MDRDRSDASAGVVRSPSTDTDLVPSDRELWLPTLLDRARKHPNDVWLVQPLGGGAIRSYTYARAMDEIRRIAGYLETCDFPRGTSIAILSQNCAHFVMMDVAIWLAGHVTVPLYPTMTPDAVRYVLEHSNSRLLFIGKLPATPAPESIPDGIECLSCEFSPPTSHRRWETIVTESPPIGYDAVRRGNEIGAILYTSGTTARPKGVELTFAAMASAVRSLIRICPPQGESRVLSYLPLAHTAERLTVEGVSFETGARIFFCHSLETFLDDLRRARPTVFAGVPRVWMKMRDRVLSRIPEARLFRLLRIPVVGGLVRRAIVHQLGFDALLYCGSGAAPCPPEVFGFFAALGIEMQELYGMTENFGYSHFCAPHAHREGFVGPPMPGVQARIGADGEIEMRSPGLMRAYHRDPEATAAAFTEDGFLRTGDRGEIGPDGYLRITGRTKEIFKTSKGKYVSPAPIENSLLGHGLLEAACVMGSGEAQPFAVVTLSESARSRDAAPDGHRAVEAELVALLDEVDAKLPPHERLSRLVVAPAPFTIEEGLLTPTLKMKRGPIEARFGARASSAPAGVSWLDRPDQSARAAA